MIKLAKPEAPVYFDAMDDSSRRYPIPIMRAKLGPKRAVQSSEWYITGLADTSRSILASVLVGGAWYIRQSDDEHAGNVEWIVEIQKES
jgi:hypothetical protein